MNDRIVDISEHAANVSVRQGHLELKGSEIGVHRLPLCDLAAVVLAHPKVTVSQNALASLAAERICVITSNSKRQPVGMMLPLAAHSTQTERFARQAEMSRPTKKRLWQQIVRAKIRTQSKTLTELHGHDAGLRRLVAKVRSGDPENLEAQAARRYWGALFPDRGFRRRREGGDVNPALNYGYAILSGLTARSITGAGLHPCLGLAHHNRYDAFCLARDLMEPYRPIVDRAVYALLPEIDPKAKPGLPTEHRKHLLESLTSRYEFSGENRTLFDWLARSASSLARIVMGAPPKLDIPEL